MLAMCGRGQVECKRSFEFVTHKDFLPVFLLDIVTIPTIGKPLLKLLVVWSANGDATVVLFLPRLVAIY